ncbi:MAG: hypothetical protein H6719_14405 [Sandaracinaceae bacterium]|nr:hypothetical protein [Sandaracinaceae bacterium]
MRVPVAVLARVRGPALAAAMLGCSSAPAEPIEPLPSPDPTVAVSTAPMELPDAVTYDVDAETERLERADRTLAAAEARRTRRIDAEEAAARPRVRQIPVQPPNHWIGVACGRG